MTITPNNQDRLLSDEELTKAIYEAMQVPYLSERHDAIKKLIAQYATQCRIDEYEYLMARDMCFYQSNIIKQRITRLKKELEDE